MYFNPELFLLMLVGHNGLVSVCMFACCLSKIPLQTVLEKSKNLTSLASATETRDGQNMKMTLKLLKISLVLVYHLLIIERGQVEFYFSSPVKAPHTVNHVW